MAPALDCFLLLPVTRTIEISVTQLLHGNLRFEAYSILNTDCSCDTRDISGALLIKYTQPLPNALMTRLKSMTYTNDKQN